MDLYKECQYELLSWISVKSVSMSVVAMDIHEEYQYVSGYHGFG